MIVGLFPSILQSGGIQRVSQHIGTVLQSLAHDRDCECHLLSLNDPVGDHSLQINDLNLRIRGFGRDKKQFALTALKLTHRNDLIYIGHPNLAPIGLLLKFLRPSARYVVAAHGTEVWEPLSPLRRWGLQSAAAVTAPSNFTASTIIKTQGLDSSRVSVLPWAIDPKLLKSNGTAHTVRPPLPEGKILLTVGRMDAAERLKGVEEVMRALLSVLKNFPDTYYVIVGEGDDRPRLELRARELAVDTHVIFIGNISDDNLKGYYEACDVYVMPSRQEGFGLVFLEAMACGKPVIGGDHGGTPDVVLDGINGFLVQHGDIEALALRLNRLLGNGELRRQMGEAGRRRVHEQFTFDTFRSGLIQILNQKGLLNRGAADV
jgi:phosphatidylinositol alpha-1,6-mannosyltransferase